MSAIDRAYSEKRDFIRMQVNSPVTISHQGNQFTGKCLDLSGTGMMIETEETFEAGTEMEVSIEQQDDNRLPFNAKVEVCRIQGENSDNHTIGLKIVEILN